MKPSKDLCVWNKGKFIPPTLQRYLPMKYLSVLCLLFFSTTLAMASEVERQKLFTNEQLMELTIEAPFSGKELRPGSEYVDAVTMGETEFVLAPGRLILTKSNGEKVEMDIQLKLRGMDRVMNCAFPPLKLNFKKTNKQVQETTEFQNIQGLKLVTHCDRYSQSEDDEEYLRVSKNALHQEYFVYKSYQLVTPRSFGVRMAKITYIDTLKKVKPLTRLAFFVEQDSDFAQRLGLTRPTFNGEEDIEKFENLPYEALAAARIRLFQSMVGNWDFSDNGSSLQNVVPLLEHENLKILVPYDFDRSDSFVNSKFDPWNGRPYTKTEEFQNPVVQAFSCLPMDQQLAVLTQFKDLGQKNILNVKNNKNLNTLEKKTMTAYYKGFLTWLTTVPSIAKKTNCKL